MREFVRFAAGVGFLSVGYVFGSLQGGLPPFLRAEPTAEPLSNAVRDRLRDTNRNLAETMQMLQEEKRYVPAIRGVNAFATSVGGVDAVADLESGQGVDPETFAGLYSGQALDEVAEHLSRDAEGHVTYKNKVVRLYNPTRLKQLFAARAEIAPLGTPAAKRSPAKPKKEAESAAPPEKSKDE